MPHAIDGRERINRHVPEGYYTRQQAADAIGRSKSTIIRWHNKGIFRSTFSKFIGGTKVWLYSEADLKELKKIANKMRTGPKSHKEEA